MNHKLKIWPAYFEAVRIGMKTFECRKNDRYFKVGQSLTLREYDPDCELYTEREIDVIVTYILTDSFSGVEKGFVIMGFVKL